MQELSGVGVALITPLKSDYSVDYESFERVIEHVIKGGVDYLVVMGTTGESPVFSWQEKLILLDFIINKNNGRKPVVFGLGGNNTFEMIDKSKDLSSFPLAAILSASPFYSRPPQQGIIRHYQLLADAFPHPIILYNVPSRTASNMEADTTLKLSEHQNIIGMKEASGHLAQCQKIINHKPTDFIFLSGDDALTLELLKLGAQGVISVVANLLPRQFTSMVKAGLNKDFGEADAINEKLLNAYDLAAREGNPSSIKIGMEAAGISHRTVRPPLFDASDSLKIAWQELLK